jgi:hypothetical protein
MLLRVFLTLCCISATLVAQEAAPILEQPTSFSVWLDLNALSRPGAEKPALPIWFESFQSELVPAKNGTPPKTVYRLRLRKMPSLHREVLLRVFFDDVIGLQPVVTAWTETGREQFRSAALGSGIGLPTHESVVIPVETSDYIDVEVAGDGSNLRAVFATSLKDSAVRRTIDFTAPPELTDPFSNLPPARPSDEDGKLFGRVKAAVDLESVLLTPGTAGSANWLFDLTGQPLAALFTFEMLNADLNAPPIVTVNGGVPGYAAVHWPDLADPAFRGEVRSKEQGMRFQYTGWVRAQFAIPGTQLRAGSNQITLSLSQGSGSVAVRNLELQLKHNWKHLDYLLTPNK